MRHSCCEGARESSPKAPKSGQPRRLGFLRPVPRLYARVTSAEGSTVDCEVVPWHHQMAGRGHGALTKKARSAMDRSWAFTSTIAAVLILLAYESIAQERQRVTFATSREHTNYTQQHLIEIGDVPGHQ